MATVVTPFRIAVPDEVLDDLRIRLRRTRHATARSGPGPWQAGVDPDYLRDLVAYWADGFDWRAREAELNALPQHTADLDGRRTHFVRLPGVRPAGTEAPPPLILCHGWPSCFVEMVPLAERLADPARFGGDPATARDVVIPSLPGFLWSDLPDRPLTRVTIAEVLHRLMTGALGYTRYGGFGGDIGGAATVWMGTRYPEHVVGVNVIHPPFPADLTDLTPAEQAFIDAEAEYDKADGGYSEIMLTRPDTIAAALLDSPAGLAAWIVDKYRDWSDCHGDVETRFDRDTLCTILTLYWVTGSIGTSFRQYYDWYQNPPRPTIGVPVAVTLSCEPGLAGFPPLARGARRHRHPPLDRARPGRPLPGLRGTRSRRHRDPHVLWHTGAVNRYVVFYESADDVATKAPPVFPAHRARLREFRDRGELLMVGTFADAQQEGSMAIFASREAAEEFAGGDPFVLQGVVRAWTLREWNEIAAEL